MPGDVEEDVHQLHAVSPDAEKLQSSDAPAHLPLVHRWTRAGLSKSQYWQSASSGIAARRGLRVAVYARVIPSGPLLSLALPERLLAYMAATVLARTTLISAPELVANPCSTSPMTSNLSRFTKRLSSPTRATCLLTLPPSLRNSGYSSTNRFMSDIELMAFGACAADRAWYDCTYSFNEPPRSPKVERWCAWKNGSVEVVRVISYGQVSTGLCYNEDFGRRTDSSGLMSGTVRRLTRPFCIPSNS